MGEIIVPVNLRQTINYSRAEAAFGCLALAQMWINQLISGYSGRSLFMHGSFVNMRKLPDVGRVSDIDLALIDPFLFRSVPEKEIMNKSSRLPEGLANNVSLPLTFVDGRVKNYLKKGCLKWLYQWIKDGQKLTQRRLDIKIYRSTEHWLLQQSPYWDLGLL